MGKLVLATIVCMTLVIVGVLISDLYGIGHQWPFFVVMPPFIAEIVLVFTILIKLHRQRNDFSETSDHAE